MTRTHTALGSLIVLLSASRAFAEPTAAQRATAEAMFQQATQLMDERRFGEACEKFAASQELDPALGTQLYLADCYDRAGRTASAWALFREVEQRARRASQPDRERIAQERAIALEGQLSRLELRVPASREVPGLELFSAGVAVPRASWNAPLPVDPGPVRIEARAPGRKPWSVQVTVAPGPARQTVELPQLAMAPTEKQAAPVTAAPTERPSSTQSTAGLILGGAGVVALAVGGFFGYRAYSRDKSSKSECRTDTPNACTTEGAALREEAREAARLSTIVTAGGAVLLAGGITLVVAAPSSAPDRTASPTRAQTANLGWQLGVRGAW